MIPSSARHSQGSSSRMPGKIRCHDVEISVCLRVEYSELKCTHWSCMSFFFHQKQKRGRQAYSVKMVGLCISKMAQTTYAQQSRNLLHLHLSSIYEGQPQQNSALHTATIVNSTCSHLSLEASQSDDPSAIIIRP